MRLRHVLRVLIPKTCSFYTTCSIINYMRSGTRVSLIASAFAGLALSSALAADPAPSAAPPDSSIEAAAPLHPAEGLPGSELTARGRDVRGVYIPYPKVRKAKPEALAKWVAGLGANAAVVDVKDDRGRVTFTRELPYARGPMHGEVRDMAAIVRAFHEAGIYVIGRLVSFKDLALALSQPAVALRHRKTGAIWRDHGNLAWVDPHAALAREHIVSVARAAEALGFDEIQLDYIRFPVEPAARYAVFPCREGTPARWDVIAATLAAVDRAIRIPLSIDVFGLTAYHPGDADGLGQSLEHLAPYVDAVTPMVYLANWPRRYWENPDPDATHGLVEGAVREIRRRLGDGIAVRPLLQAFKWRAKLFSNAFLADQIRASRDGGSSGYLFWNQSGSYGPVHKTWRWMDEAQKREEEELLARE
jgi:hypothetical protein